MDALVPDGFCDPITMELMCDPVIIEGISFERSSAESWLRDNDTHPSTGARLVSKVYLIFNYVSLISNRSFLHSSQVLTPNINLRQAIDDWKRTQANKNHKLLCTPSSLFTNVIFLMQSFWGFLSITTSRLKLRNSYFLHPNVIFHDPYHYYQH